jgi:hypothetical protein
MAMLQKVLGKATQPWVSEDELPMRFKAPLELRFATLKVCPYTLTGNGKAILVLQSSQWFPVSVVPGMIVLPVVVDVT